MRALVLFILLAVFWALLSGQWDYHHHAFLIWSGVVCCAFTLFMAHRLKIIDDESVPVEMFGRLLIYLPWLMWQVVLSNIDVAKRVWAANLDINPQMIRVPYSTKKGFATAVYANSITMTPGTVTVEVYDGDMLIHALHDEAAAGLQSGDMHDKVLKLEGMKKEGQVSV